MGKILIVKNADFSNVAVEQVNLDSLTWTDYMPFEAYNYDEYSLKVSSNYSFNTTVHIFSGSANYKKVKISMKAKTTINDIRVSLIEVSGFDTLETKQNATFICDLGTMNLISDEYVYKTFDLPTLEQNKLYSIAVLSKAEFYYLTSASHFVNISEKLYSIKYEQSEDKWYVEECHPHGSRGSFAYSYFQMKFGY